ncbi:MAG: molybdopterin cofactor-binding domain-containing protein [Gemmatimonadota bacterium]
MGKWTRRAFIGAGTVVGGGLVLGVGGIVFAPNRLRSLPDRTGGGEGERLTTWIKITPDNDVVVVIPHCEMGQGAVTGLAMMLAEELEADWSRVRIEEAPADDVFANGYLFRAFAEEFGLEVPRWLERALDFGAYKVAGIADLQMTGGSTSTRATGQFGMRVAGATAKVMLLEAAARRFDVTTEELTARDSRITHGPSGRSATYGELATEAAALDVPRHPPLKSRAEYRLVGTPTQRRDIPDKVTGNAQFGIDVALPDMWYAAIVAAPIPGGVLRGVDPAPAMAVAGVREVVQLENAVAVVADGYWQATQGLRALTPDFSDGGVGAVDSERIYANHAAALDAEGTDETVPGATRTVSAEYRVPYLAHATMEPMCATARFEEGRLEVWAGTQDPLNARRAAAAAAGIDADDVLMHNLHLGGGFGRRLPGTFDYVEQAVKIAQAVSPRAVKLIWSREEDMQHGYYRPTVLSRMRGELDANGRPLRWSHLFTGSRLMDSSAATPAYAIENLDIRAVDPPRHLRTGSWRSVASSQHGFFMESFVDELASAAGEDPFEYRRSLLNDEPRHRAVLERAAEMAGWGSAPPEGRARGIAIVQSFGTVVAEVGEVGLDANGAIRVYRVDAAVDCGLVVNPDQAVAQIEGGIIFGLSAALFHEITVRGGAVEQRSFPDYEMIRLANAPQVNVAFLDSDAPMGGLGEPGVPPIAPAVANAVFALTGQRLRTLPLRLS